MNGDTKPQPDPAAQPQPAGQWRYTSGPSTDTQSPLQEGSVQDHQSEEISEFEWTGSEFIAHSKGSGWYTAYGAISLVAVVAAYFISQDFVPPIMIGAIAIIFGVAANRPPRTLTYRIVSRGIYAGHQFFTFRDYKAFSIIEEGAFSNITFWPLKRFGLPVSIYYDPRDEDAIATAIANHIPMQPHQMDLADRVMRRIRF